MLQFFNNETFRRRTVLVCRIILGCVFIFSGFAKAIDPLGDLAKKERVQAFFRIPDRRMRRADRLIDKYGYWTAFFSFIPAIGEVFLVALGIMRASKTKVFVLMALGKLLRYSLIVISAIGIAEFFGF